MTALVLVGLVACGHGRVHRDEPPLRVGTSGDYPPFSVDRDGRLEGFDVDLARRVARDLGRRLEIVRFRWPDLLSDLAADRFDVAMSGVTMRPERALAATFTRPVAETGAVALTRYGVATSQKDLDRGGIRIAVNGGGHLEQVARRLFPHAMLVPVADNRALPARLDDGAADAILLDDAEADAVGAELPAAVRIGPLTRDRKAWLARDRGLAARLDGWLREHEADGTLAALRARTLGASHAGPATPFAADLAALAALVDLRLAMMPAVAAGKEAAGLPIVDRAQEARVLDAVRARASAAGLSVDPLVHFFATQIEVGRALQESFLATPPDQRPPVEPLDLSATARPALATLSDGIIAHVAELTRDSAPPNAASPARLADELDGWLTPPAGRMKIGRALAGLLRAERGF